MHSYNLGVVRALLMANHGVGVHPYDITVLSPTRLPHYPQELLRKNVVRNPNEVRVPSRAYMPSFQWEYEEKQS